MPKISNDWLNPGAKEIKGTKKRNNMTSENIFFRPAVNEPFVARIVGGHAEFIPHWPRVEEDEVNEKGEKEFKPTLFPDAEERRHKPTRICIDDTKSWDRKKDIDKYLEETKCPWCKMKYQGYDGSNRFAFNILMRDPASGNKVCRVLEIPPGAMKQFSAFCRDEELKEFIPEDGLGSMTSPVFLFKINKPEINKWTIELNFSKKSPFGLGNGVFELDEEDIEALKKINPDAENEEDYLRGHDLAKIYAKDYMSTKLQKEIFGKVYAISEYELSQGYETDVVEEFEKEVDEMAAMDKQAIAKAEMDEDFSDDVSEEEIEESVKEADDEWGDVEATSDEEDDDDSPLW